MNSKRMTNDIVDTSQQKAARIAGFAYLFFTIGSTLHFAFIDSKLIASRNISVITDFIKTNELQFRIGIVGDLIIFVNGTILSLALYIILKTVNRNLALFALLMFLIQATLAVVIELTSFTVLLLLNGEDYLSVFNTDQLKALVGLFLNVRAAGWVIVGIFVGLGSIVYFYLFYKSKYIPRILALFAIFSFLLTLIWASVKIIVPGYAAMPMVEVIETVFYMPVFLFQLTIGIWLIIKGINTRQRNIPVSESARTEIKT